MTTPTQTPSTEIKVVEVKAGLYSRIFFGIFCILSGAAIFIWGIVLDLRHENLNLPKDITFWTMSHILMVGGALWAVFGGMMLPSVFDAAKPVLTFAFPNGLPLLGGRRNYDVPKDPPEVPPNA